MKVKRKATPTYLLRPVKIFQDYQIVDLPKDIMAGITVAIILLPQAIAFTLIAELPPQMGLYAAIVAAIFGALWGSSNQMQTGPANTTSLLILSVLLTIAEPGSPKYVAAAGLLAVMVGVFCLVMGLARLGILVNFISDSLIVGFTSGAGILIMVSQLRNLLRLDFPSSPSILVTLRNVSLHFQDIHMPSLILGVGTIAVVILLKKISPKAPGLFMGIIASALAVVYFGLEQQGVSVIGQLPRGLPPLAQLPLFDWDLIRELSNGALAVSVIVLVEASSIGRSIASQSAQRLDSNQEFVGQGLSNIAAGFFSGYPVAASFSRSAVNLEAGARTPLAAVFTSVFVLLGMLVFGAQAAFVPTAALSGVLIVTALGLVEKKEFARIWRGSPGDRTIMVVTFLGILFLPLEFAVVSGIMISLATYLLRTSVPKVYPVVPDAQFEHFIPQVEQPSCPQLVVFEILGDMYFGAVHHIEETLQKYLDANPEQRYLLLRMSNVVVCDITGINALEAIMRDLRNRRGDLFLVKVQQSVLELMKTIEFYDELGGDHFLESEGAVAHLFYKVLDPTICIYECEFKIFDECLNLPKQVIHLDESCFTDIPAEPLVEISPEALWADLHQAAAPKIIDVREPREFKKERIPQAELIPLPKILTEGAEIPRDVPVVLVCRTGRRSSRAANFLISQGHENITILKGGIVAWEAAGLLAAVE